MYLYAQVYCNLPVTNTVRSSRRNALLFYLITFSITKNDRILLYRAIAFANSTSILKFFGFNFMISMKLLLLYSTSSTAIFGKDYSDGVNSIKEKCVK